MAITQRGQLIRDDSFFPVGWKYKYITATGATVVKSSSGILHEVVLNAPKGTSVISLCDSASVATGTFGSITPATSTTPTVLRYDVAFDNGLVVNVGTATSDITISYI